MMMFLVLLSHTHFCCRGDAADELVKTNQHLSTIHYSEMPAFGVVENLVDEEVRNARVIEGVWLHESHVTKQNYLMTLCVKIAIFSSPCLVSMD